MEGVSRLSPLGQHINAIGWYDFRLRTVVEGGALRPLWNPNALCALELVRLNDEE